MKTFRYKLGHEAGKTMTVAELKKKLNRTYIRTYILGLHVD